MSLLHINSSIESNAFVRSDTLVFRCRILFVVVVVVYFFIKIAQPLCTSALLCCFAFHSYRSFMFLIPIPFTLKYLFWSGCIFFRHALYLSLSLPLFPPIHVSIGRYVYIFLHFLTFSYLYEMFSNVRAWSQHFSVSNKCSRMFAPETKPKPYRSGMDGSRCEMIHLNRK